VAKIDEIRKWLQGERVEGLPDHWKEKQDRQEEFDRETANLPPEKKRARGLNLEKARHMHNRRHYTISTDGEDAVLNFGKHKGSKLSELAESRAGRGYLRWILQNDFPKELQDLAMRALDRVGEAPF
jgi:hypothetical protein